MTEAEEIVQLRESIDRLCRELSASVNDSNEYSAQRDRALSDVRQLECQVSKLLADNERLRGYAQHKITCARLNLLPGVVYTITGSKVFPEPPPCNCGYYELLGLVEPKPKHDPNNDQCPLNDPETYANPATPGLDCSCHETKL